MAKISFYLVLFSFLSGVAQAAQKTPAVTLKESFLPDYVAQKENAKPEDIRRIVLKKDSAFKHGVILLNNSLSCGVGLCSYYVFIKNEKGSFDYAGIIEGVFKDTKEVAGSTLPEIITESRSGEDKAKSVKWNFNQETKIYETK